MGISQEKKEAKLVISNLDAGVSDSDIQVFCSFARCSIYLPAILPYRLPVVNQLSPYKFSLFSRSFCLPGTVRRVW